MVPMKLVVVLLALSASVCVKPGVSQKWGFVSALNPVSALQGAANVATYGMKAAASAAGVGKQPEAAPASVKSMVDNPVNGTLSKILGNYSLPKVPGMDSLPKIPGMGYLSKVPGMSSLSSWNPKSQFSGLLSWNTTSSSMMSPWTILIFLAAYECPWLVTVLKTVRLIGQADNVFKTAIESGMLSLKQALNVLCAVAASAATMSNNPLKYVVIGLNQAIKSETIESTAAVKVLIQAIKAGVHNKSFTDNSEPLTLAANLALEERVITKEDARKLKAIAKQADAMEAEEQADKEESQESKESQESQKSVERQKSQESDESKDANRNVNVDINTGANKNGEVAAAPMPTLMPTPTTTKGDKLKRAARKNRNRSQ